MATNDEWIDALKAKGHVPRMVSYEEGETYLNMFVLDCGFHNGPGCETCGWSTCEHCNDVDAIPKCKSPAIEGEAIDVTTGRFRALPG